MAQSPILKELKQCMRQAHGNKVLMDSCEKTFVAAGGTAVQDGGKVFTPPSGDGEAFVTTGGKVFG